MEQRSEEWFEIRVGKVTASRLADLLARTKTGFSASRDNYKAELVTEIITGKPYDSYTNPAMQRGIDLEPEARARFQSRIFEAVTETGFVIHPDIERAGASPDGLVGDEGLVEIKCPNTSTHIGYLLSDNVPQKYETQMQWQMACTGRKWCDFVSYDNRLPEAMQLFVKRVNRDEMFIATAEEAVRRFIAEVEETVATLKGKYNV